MLALVVALPSSNQFCRNGAGTGKFWLESGSRSRLEGPAPAPPYSTVDEKEQILNDIIILFVRYNIN